MAGRKLKEKRGLHVLNRVFDGIIGLAIGDALGVPVEFEGRQEIAENPVRSMREYGTHCQPMGDRKSVV